ncbi:CvpA family protein [Streptococcus moroccensis]|uniref:Membrane protein required for colicin V production n=1 Tax=Streptococcus moroccensis TaxID=1451356 RepID=A0ABT9YSK7_9STRE|nr:CvpA family protein [Streptococcus moroccensis]MDQ0222970.1 putative membrane protein required for colicin V production [Streptococcus moroccensis]
MISLGILLILAWQFYIGYRRGLGLQGTYFLGSLISLFVASLYYRPLGQWLYLWVPYASAAEGASTYFFDQSQLFELDQVFYAGLAFFTIYLLVYAVIRFLGLFLHIFDLESLDVPHTRIVAGIMSVFVSWLGIEMVLTILATVPIGLVQDKLHESLMVRIMVDTPLVSHFLKNLWVTKILG